MSTNLNQFLIGVMAPERYMTFHSTIHTERPKAAESFARDFWGEFEHPNTMILLVIDTETGQHQTFHVDCPGYRFDAYEVDSSQAVKELEMWAVYHQKHMLDRAELISVQMDREDLAWDMGRKIQSARDPKSIGVPLALLHKLKDIATAQQHSGGWMCIEDHFFTFVKFQLDQPIPEVWKSPVNPH
ncbi:hypothetical protein [Deinococcus cellulosilyticus]|uniref:Uncharacterized protein n=1 Tax=Deinococcus cellulosilyticus (strain DSM 18568 / NBRC 106333 / KACC 11606 / 5516J-15) TaxID=1223518 RepID=A0A511MX00_DEIC1|nr:hypothetical protein [Deinococcus cellulosilyticus]GEM44798.1 hypothetical protein DC3_04330 [Deinococcus cellulosilyticus NBRC 106333 = KACC 11606]